MLRRLHGLAVRLHPFRRAVAGAGLLFLVLAGVGLLRSDSDTLLRLALLGTLWAGLFYAGIELFHRIPRTPRPDEGIGVRLGLGLRRMLHDALATLVVLFALVLVWMSVRLAFV